MKLSLGFLIIVFTACPASAITDCDAARSLVTEVRASWESGHPDHAQNKKTLVTARRLCPELKEVWTYSYCTAKALKEENEARVFERGAAQYGVQSISCGTQAPGATASRRGPAGMVQKKFALLIGIGKFADSRITNLQYAAKDARDLARILQDPSYGRFEPASLTILTDELATRPRIMDALQELTQKASEDDLVLIYVSSHGSPNQASKGLTGIGYIATYDTEFARIYDKSLSYRDFAEWTRLIKARRMVIFLDTCYSGEIAREGSKDLIEAEPIGVDASTAQLLLSGEGTYVISSSRADERSWESDEFKNSYFTRYLMEALRQSPPWPIQQIFDYLSRNVPAVVAREKGSSQHPQMSAANSPGDLVIGVIPKASNPGGGSGQ